MRRKHWDGLAPNMSGTKVLTQIDGKPPEWDSFTGDSLSSPPEIGDVAPAAANFTTVDVTGAITSTVAPGNPPMVIASTDKVVNLNADKLDGKDFADPGAIGGGTPAAGTFTALAAAKLELTAQTVNPAADGGAGSVILDGVVNVDVGAVVNDANDWILLPAIAGLPIGHTITIACNAGTNFEMRTPAGSNTKINDVDADGGAAEYLCTDTEVITITKRTTTGWVAYAHSKLGAAVAAVVPHAV